MFKFLEILQLKVVIIFLKIPLFKHSNVLFLIFEYFIVHLIINFTPMFEWNQFKAKQHQQQKNKWTELNEEKNVNFFSGSTLTSNRTYSRTN